MATSSLLPAAAPFFPVPCHRAPSPLSPSARPFQPSRVVLVQWMPPPRGWFKMNFDGSVYHDGSRRASIGGAIRDSTGRVVLTFAEQTEHSTVGIVEARAMIRGLHLALELGLDRVIVEGDDLVLVQLLRGEETQTRIPVAMQEEILGLLRCFPGRDVRHVYREGNQVAHAVQAGARPGGVWRRARAAAARCVGEGRRGQAWRRARAHGDPCGGGLRRAVAGVWRPRRGGCAYVCGRVAGAIEPDGDGGGRTRRRPAGLSGASAGVPNRHGGVREHHATALQQTGCGRSERHARPPRSDIREVDARRTKLLWRF
ncbi:unnamed protein product [Urochloa humidicola]